MSSDRQIAANQNNAQKSTGPSSKAGREISRRNAHRHGLAIKIGSDPAFRDEIEKLSQTLSSGAQFTLAHVREAAEAELDLMRIRKVRAWLFETYYFTDNEPSEGLVKLNKKLAKLERYERRAFSRRKRALRAMCRSAALIPDCSGDPQQRREP
jgi:hypothetical protein